MDNLKKCNKCELIRKNEDFLMESLECYKCVYEYKKNLTPSKSRRCKLCNKCMPTTRWTYCGAECATEAKEIRRKIPSPLAGKYNPFPKLIKYKPYS